MTEAEVRHPVFCHHPCSTQARGDWRQAVSTWQAVHEKRRMGLDVCIDDQGHPYLGHPKEYNEKRYEPFFLKPEHSCEAERAAPGGGAAEVARRGVPD